ncbi:hypothetical protein ADM98_07860 [Exiguobacterium sp. BMC-KP]|uniref:hypothetical protein n=1 Tax=Exiguobacterium sp. BMC-KP TaxID=1684312 RepID=UPI0006AA43DC|nr:hypothetical protein [Exiguobacterium sp. BMC-KP]KOP28845.1 hypothetical protein ADM98_07860 [Exiguobacterium sp. BMC-KP]
MKRRGRMLILVSSVILFAGCTDEAATTKSKAEIKTATHTSQKIDEKRHRVLTHEQYEKLFEHMNQHVKIHHFQLKASTVGDDFTVVDRALSFGKRRWLTVDGTIDSGSTQESLYFENKNQDTQVSVHFAYTDQYIGNDMLQYQSNDENKELNQELSNRSDLIMISFKNIIITVQQHSLNKVDPDTTQRVAQQMIDELENYHH